MRSLLKKAPFEVKNIDLNDLVRETVEFLSALAIARKVELSSVITPERFRSSATASSSNKSF
jgi:hypothetical protein